ncbi:hypothetical protein HHK36_012425 [Tetracentron sinense]|uniref:AIG1-type G domain-containing protein n=1 Tax=Tetracentron sinense TaxID=13715 RepID=A0A834Z998_TETSI|nr:hypothetical protein HHK36_012425 [Tetracentron sinense]
MDSKPSVSLSTAQGTPSPAEVSPLQQSPLNFSPFSSSSGYLPIRAPPSDYDIETAIENNGDKIDKRSSSRSSSSSDSSSESEGFVSGEDEFETASERPFVGDPDEESLEMDMEEEDNGVPFVRVGEMEPEIVQFAEPVVGSSNFSSPKTVMPNAQFWRDDEDEGMVSEVEDDGVSGIVRIPHVGGFEKPDGVVETPVLGGEGGEDGSLLGRDSSVVEKPEVGSVLLGPVGDGFPELIGVAAQDSEMAIVDSSVENPDSRVFGSEEKEPSSKINYTEDSILDELVEDRDPDAEEASTNETSVASKEDTLPETTRLDQDVNPTLEKQKLEETELKDGPAAGKEDTLPEATKLDQDGNPTLEKQKLVETELKDGPAAEQKNDVLSSGGGNVSVNSTTGGDTVLDAKQPIEVVEESTIVGSGTDELSYGVEESVDSKFVNGIEDVNCTNGGDLVAETNSILSGWESGVVGETEEDRVSEMKGVEAMVERSVSLGTEKPVDLELVTANIDVAKVEKLSDVDHTGSDQNLEPLTNQAAETVEMEPQESRTDVAKVEKDDNLEQRSLSVDSVAEVSADNSNDEKNGDSVDESVTIGQDNNIEKQEVETEPETGSGVKPDEPIIDLTTDKLEFESSRKVDGQETPTFDSAPVSAEPSPAQEAIHLENDNACVTSQGDRLGDGSSNKSQTPEFAASNSIVDPEVKQMAEDETNNDQDEEVEDKGSVSDEDAEGLIFGSSDTAKQIMKELEQKSDASSHSGAGSSQDHSQRIDGQIVTESDEEVDTDEEGDGKGLFDSAALAALLKAATGAGSNDSSITINAPDGSRLFSVERPAGLGSSMRSLKPAPRPNRANFFTPSDLTAGGESENNLSEEEKKKLEKIQLIRVKFLRLVHRLGHSPEESIAGQVLYRLVLAAGRHTSQSFSLETAKRSAMQLEAEGKDDLDFSLNILVLGKTGVGKSATINSIFGEEKALIDAFEPATTAVKEITGMVDGVKIRVLDTPGLRPSVMEQSFNRKILSAIKKFMKKCPPDIVLYVDRLDTQTRDLNDLPLLRSITGTLGSSIWRSAIVTLTHAASAPPDGPSGSPLSYEVFVAQRSHVVQQSIGQAVGDLRLMNPSLMNPVSLVENHPSCRKNREGQRVLPNGQSWRPQLLLLSYSMKILSEASSLSKTQDPFDNRKLFGFRARSPPLPYLLSSLLQSRAHPKLSADQGGENGDSDIDLGDLSDSDQEEDEDEYDQLPPFKALRKSQIAKLSKEQRKAYFEEYDYRVKLLQKKQWREELKRLREVKKKGKDGEDDYGYMGEDVDQENGSPAAVPVPLPDMVLPPSFDGDNPAYRYRFLEPTSQLLARPVLDTHGWDHDCGYDGVSLEENLAIAGRFPAGIAVQITKDKKEFNIHLDSSVSAKYGESGSNLAGFDIQTIGKQLAYIVRGETKFKNLKKNKTAAGVSITFLGENVATGLKIEDQIAVGKRLILVGSTGAVRSQGDMAYGANLEARLKEKDFPIGQDQSTLGVSLMRWRGDLALGANLQSQISIGRNSKMAVRVGLNNKLSGQITIRTSSSEQLQIALMGVLPIAITIFRSIWPGVGENYSAY